jgi:hypothetical protein
MEYKVYEVVAKDKNFRIGDEVVISKQNTTEDDGSELVLVEKITLAKHTNINPLCHEKSYWFTGLNWVERDKLKYLRTE